MVRKAVGAVTGARDRVVPDRYSSDTVVVLSALLADTRPEAHPVIILSCITAAGLLAAVAAHAVSHPRLEQRILRLAPTLTPLILIAVGLYILANTATDLVS